MALKLVRQLSTDSLHENLLVSPLCVQLALSIAMNASDGQTRSEIGALLGISPTEMVSTNRMNAELVRSLSRPGAGIQLSVANSLWADNAVEVRKQFAELCRKDYLATVTRLDFSNPEAPSTLNRWASKATRGLVQQMVERVDPLTVAMLTSAMFFRGKWAMPFSPKYTTPGVFHLIDGSRVERQMMQHCAEFACLASDSFRAVALPFAGRRFLLYVFVPNDTLGLPDFLEKLDSDNWHRWLSEFRTEEIVVRLPRFSVASNLDLACSLVCLGVTSAFDPSRADFAPMVAKSPLPVWLGSATSKSLLEVDEAGARAATVMALGAVSGCPDEVIADRPFFVALWDSATQAMLLAGTIYNPLQPN